MFLMRLFRYGFSEVRLIRTPREQCLRLIHLSSRAKIHVSESVYGMFETKSLAPVEIVFTSPRVVTAVRFRISESLRPNSFSAIPPVQEDAKALRILLSLSEGKPPRRFAQGARSRKSLEWAA